MQYLLMIYAEETKVGATPPAELGSMLAEYGALTASMKEKGQWVGGNRLKPIATATTVRIREGKVSKTHGPFAETREQLGGYYLVNATDLDEACALAARIPAARLGSVEVRPIFEM
jgi:hypothetical protein